MRFSKWLVWGALLSLLSLALVACDDSDEAAEEGSAPDDSAAESEAGLVVGQQAPAFTLPATDGSEVSLSDYVGEQPVLLYFHMAVG